MRRRQILLRQQWQQANRKHRKEKYQNLNKQLEYQNMLLGTQLQQSIKKIEELQNKLKQSK
jgi:hypothetical protein